MDLTQKAIDAAKRSFMNSMTGNRNRLIFQSVLTLISSSPSDIRVINNERNPFFEMNKMVDMPRYTRSNNNKVKKPSTSTEDFISIDTGPPSKKTRSDDLVDVNQDVSNSTARMVNDAKMETSIKESQKSVDNGRSSQRLNEQSESLPKRTYICDWCNYSNSDINGMRNHLDIKRHPSASQYYLKPNIESLDSDDDCVETSPCLVQPTAIDMNILYEHSSVLAFCPICHFVFSNKFVASWHHQVIHHQNNGKYCLAPVSNRKLIEVKNSLTCEKCNTSFERLALLHQHWSSSIDCSPFMEKDNSVVLGICLTCKSRCCTLFTAKGSNQCGVLLSLRNHCLSHINRNKSTVQMQIITADANEKQVYNVEPFETSSCDAVELMLKFAKQCVLDARPYLFVSKKESINRMLSEIKVLEDLL